MTTPYGPDPHGSGPQGDAFQGYGTGPRGGVRQGHGTGETRPESGADPRGGVGPGSGAGEAQRGSVAGGGGRGADASAAEWAMSADPADDWILDPQTGEYRMRLPGERLPTAPAPARAAAPSTGAEAGVRSTREMEIVRLPEPATPARAAGRAAGRAADRGSRRAGGRRRNVGGSGSGGRKKGGGGLAIVVALGAVGVVGCGLGGYLLLHGGSKPQPACSTAAAATPMHASAGPADGGPAIKAGPHAAPINVRVSIYDGSGKFGSAESVLSWMQNKQGYLRTSNEGAVAPRATTSLVYEPPHADQARTLAAALHLPTSDLHGTGKGDGLRDPMILTLGKDFTEPGKAPSPPPASTPTTGVGTSCAPAT